jgi:hypothetical protein
MRCEPTSENKHVAQNVRIVATKIHIKLSPTGCGVSHWRLLVSHWSELRLMRREGIDVVRVAFIFPFEDQKIIVMGGITISG